MERKDIMDEKASTVAVTDGSNQPPPPYPGNVHNIYSPAAPEEPPLPYNPLLGLDIQNASNIDQRNITEAILASQNVAAAILQHGRKAITVTCPNCRSNAETKITIIEHEGQTNGPANFKVMRYVSGGMAIFLTVVFIFVAILIGSIYLLGCLLFVLALLGLVHYGITKLYLGMAPLSNDIEHRCSACQILLGVNLGLKQFEGRRRNR